MIPSARSSSRSTPRLLHVVFVSLLLASVTGCASTKRDAVTTGSIPTRVSTASLDSMTATQLAEAEQSVGAAYVKDPKNRDVGLRYANILSMTGKNTQALAVMQQVAIAHPADREVLAAYGKAQAAAGQFEQALATIDRARRRTTRTGACIRHKARFWIKWAVPRKRERNTARRWRPSRTSRASCPISACPTCSQAI
jgi:tetratricopeptide (TPR) repeat protein